MFSQNKIISGWNKFFFEEKPTEGIALFRIVWAGLLLCYFFLDLGNIADFYGPHAIISHTTAENEFPYLHVSLFKLFKPTYEVAYGVMIVYGISLLTSMLGLFTRGSLMIAFLCMASLHQRNIWLLSSSEMLMRAITILLICSPCGHSFSVDSLLGRYFENFRQKRTWPVWALRLIQIQISVVYLWTCWHKIKGETWLDGTAVYYATRIEGLTNFPVPFLFDSPLFLKLATWSALLVEFSIGAFIWVKPLRKPIIILGVLFHLGIEYTMSIPFFELTMIVLLINFFTPEELKSFVLRLKEIFITAIQDTTLASELKEKLIRTVRGQHETVN
jgi:hypothetical protein